MANSKKRPRGRMALLLLGFAPSILAGASNPVPPLVESGFHEIFDGKSLQGWDCDPDFWRVADGAIVGESNVNHQPKQNTFCIWKGGEPGDFELKAEFKLTGTTDGNSGIQYRSEELPDVARWVMKGYQFDMDLKQQYTGQIYEERGRGFLALRGQIAEVPESGKSGSIGSLGEASDLRGIIRDNDWNELHIIARGNTLIQLLNGRVTAVLVDNDPEHRKMKGEIGIQLHRLPGVAMKIETRHIRIKSF
ncbi:MAG TPA: DUF1080 domain-containing protein [Bryobacteraceae bacterium]|nr:DUF1080 domain-containing protein [Bryobacteraceae bacterium]